MFQIKTSVTDITASSNCRSESSLHERKRKTY